MAKDNHQILVVHITDRVSEVAKVQLTLSQSSSIIKTRLGLHTVSEDYNGSGGIIVLELLDNKSEIDKLSEKLNSIDGVEAKEIEFKH